MYTILLFISISLTTLVTSSKWNHTALVFLWLFFFTWYLIYHHLALEYIYRCSRVKRKHDHPEFSGIQQQQWLSTMFFMVGGKLDSASHCLLSPNWSQTITGAGYSERLPRLHKASDVVLNWGFGWVWQPHACIQS